MVKYLNGQKYSECQLVTAINIKQALTGGTIINQDSSEYEKLVDLVMARNGSAISIVEAWEKLNIKPDKEYDSIYSWIDDDYPVPVEATIWHCKYGFHSVCIVDYEPKSNAIRVPNFKYETTRDNWMFCENLHYFIKKMPNNNWCIRTFMEVENN